LVSPASCYQCIPRTAATISSPPRSACTRKMGFFQKWGEEDWGLRVEDLEKDLRCRRRRWMAPSTRPRLPGARTRWRRDGAARRGRGRGRQWMRCRAWPGLRSPRRRPSGNLGFRGGEVSGSIGDAPAKDYAGGTVPEQRRTVARMERRSWGEVAEKEGGDGRARGGGEEPPVVWGGGGVGSRRD
jgi:hypothetical protein